MVQVIQIMAAEVFHLNLFQIIPDAFIRVQIRRIARQAFQMDALRRALPQKILNRLTVMGWQTIPDDEQLTMHVPQQMLQKADNGGAIESLFLDHHQQPTIGRDGTDSRQMVPSQWHPQDRCLSPRGIGANGSGQQVEACFIDKH